MTAPKPVPIGSILAGVASAIEQAAPGKEIRDIHAEQREVDGDTVLEVVAVVLVKRGRAHPTFAEIDRDGTS